MAISRSRKDLGIKDILAEMEGWPTTLGSRFMKGVKAGTTAELTRRFLTAGLNPLGKTNVPELGLLPVTDLAQIQRITSLRGAKLPQSFVEALSAQGDSPQGDSQEGQFDVGVQFASEQSQQLIDAGVPGIHYYVLNKSQATASVLRNLRWDR